MLGGFSAWQGVKDAYGFVPQAWVKGWLALLLLLGLCLLPLWVTFSDYGFSLWIIAFVAVVLMTLGGLYRAAIFGHDASKKGLGFGGIQLGAAEWGLISGGVKSGLFMTAIALCSSIILVIVSASTHLSARYNATHKTLVAAFFEPYTSEKIAIMVAVGVIALVILGLMVALSPYQAVSVAEGRGVALRALRVSDGKLGKLALGLLLVIVPFVALLAAMVMGIISMTPLTLSLLVGLAISVVLPAKIGYFSSLYNQAHKKG